jgi:hypothetical protein
MPTTRLTCLDLADPFGIRIRPSVAANETTPIRPTTAPAAATPRPLATATSLDSRKPRSRRGIAPVPSR